ncbi:MAG: hypothetical protein FJZ63_06535 [Chlamydiae bacterium]|nr:hypothetical protein [Chlamydiota bacterium]
MKTNSLWLVIFLAGCFFLFAVCFKLQPLTIKKILKTIPQEEKSSLEWFFQAHVDTIPYVLFGSKPMATTEFLDPFSSSTFSEGHDADDWLFFFFGSVSTWNLKTKKGWNTWKKYQHLLPSSNYIFLERKWNNWVNITLINKKAFLDVVEKNLDIFQSVLGQDTTPQRVLESCITCNDILADALHNHDGLFGILLGYGTHNAKLFHRRFEIKRNPQRSQFSLTKKPLKPSEGFSTIEEEYNTICQKLTSFDNYIIYDFNPLLLVLPGFVADHSHPETQQLRKEYLKQYKTIIHEYQKGDFLEVTFKQFNDKKPLLKHLLTQRSQP